MNIAKETIRFLQDSGWTQKQLAEELGIHPVSLSKFLNDKRKRRGIGEKLFDFLSKTDKGERDERIPNR